MAATVKIEGDADGAVSAAKKTSAALAEVKSQLRAAAKEAEHYDRLAKKIFEDNLTPLEKYNRKMADLQHLMMQGKINSSAYHAEAAKLKDTLDQTKVDQKDLTISSAATNSVLEYAKQFATIAAAAQFARTAIAGAMEEAAKAKQSQEASIDYLGELQQLPGNFADMKNQSKQFRAAGAVDTMNEAYGMMFQLISAGLEKDSKLFQDVGAARILKDVPGGIKSVAGIQQSFGQEEAGDAKAILAKLLVASGVTLETVNDLGQYAPRLGASARALNFSDEESLATYSVLTKTYGKEEAKSRTVEFMRAIEANKIEGKSISEAVANIAAREAKGEELRDILGGSAVAIEGYRTTRQNMEQIKQVTADLQAANSGVLIDQKLRDSDTDPTLASSKRMRRSAGEQEVQRMDLGDREMLRESLAIDSDLYSEEVLGHGALRRSVERMARGTNDYINRYVIGQDDELGWYQKQNMENNIKQRRQEGDTRAVELLERMLNTSEAIKESSAKIANPQTRPSVPKPEQ